MIKNEETKFFLLWAFLVIVLSCANSFANEPPKRIDPFPKAYFCKSLPADQNRKFSQYEKNMDEARKANDTCRNRNRKKWEELRKNHLNKQEKNIRREPGRWHRDADWRRKQRSTDKEIRKARENAEFYADKTLCSFFMRPQADPMSSTIDSISSLNNWFKTERSSIRFADNLADEIYNYIILRASGELGDLELDQEGNLKGDEFKGNFNFFGKMKLYFSDGKSNPKRVLHFLADYIENGEIEERQFKLQKIQVLLNVFQDILKKDTIGYSEFSALKPTNHEQIAKYRSLTKEIFQSLLGQKNENMAVKKLTTSTHKTASNLIKDFLELKLESFEIERREDRESILGAVSYVMGETEQNTTPPIQKRDFEYFEGSSMFGKHLKGNIKTCLECALNMSAMVMCYQRSYQALQDPLLKWTLRKFEINTPAPKPNDDSSLSIKGTTRVKASLGTVGDRFEDYLKTGDFFGSFLQPSSVNNIGPKKDQSLSISFLNITKNVFENAYSNPPEDYITTRDLTEDKESALAMKKDPDAMNWIAFQNAWYEKRRNRIEKIKKEVAKDYAIFNKQQRPAISLEAAIENKIQDDPYSDKLKLHYAMESTLRFMTKQSIDTLIDQLGLESSDIEKMKDPLKSAAIETRNLILDKKLDIYSRTIPKIIGKRLDEVLNDQKMKDLPLFEYAIENLRQKSIEDGFDIINSFMNDESIQQVVQGISQYKYLEITQKFGIKEDEELAKGLKAIIVGDRNKPSLSNEIFGEVQGFFKDIHQLKTERGIGVLDDEFRVLFDNQLLKLNDDLLNYTFTGQNKKLFKDLVFNLYDKYMKQIISIDPDYRTNEDLLSIKRKIDAFVKEKADKIINKLKIKSHGISPIKVIESIEENLVDVLNQDIFGNEEAKELLKALTNELMAVNIEKYAKFILPTEEAKKITQNIKKRPEGTSKMDAAFNTLIEVFYSNYGKHNANIAEVVLSLKSNIDSTFDSFFEQGNQKSIGELVQDLNDKATRDLGVFILNNKELLRETIQTQKDIIEYNITRYTDEDDKPLVDAIRNFQIHVDQTLTGDESIQLFTSRIEKLLERDKIKISELLAEGEKFAHERFWLNPKSRQQAQTMAQEIINAEKRRVEKLLSKTYDHFNPIKKKQIMARFEKLFEQQKKFLNTNIDNIFKKVKNGEYQNMYQETLANTIKAMNQNILKDSEFRNLLKEVLKNSISNSIEDLNTSTIIPESTKRELTLIGKKITKDIDKIFSKEVEKEFETISDVISFVDDMAHYSINEVIIVHSKDEDIGSLFASTIYDTKGLDEFKDRVNSPSDGLKTIKHNKEIFYVPHPNNFKRAANLTINNLRLQQMPVSEKELSIMPTEEMIPETFGQYIERLQNSNFSVISPMLGEIAEVIRFQSFCDQFQPIPPKCIKDIKNEEGQNIYNKKFLQVINFIRTAAGSEQEGCKKNVSQLLTRQNLMKVAEESSNINRDKGDYWNLNLWLSEVIKSHRGAEPSIIECAFSRSMSNLQTRISENGKEIENYAGVEVYQILNEILSPDMLISLREKNPNIYRNAYDELAEFLLHPNQSEEESKNISDVITDYINEEIIQKIIETPKFRKKALLLFSNTDLNRPVKGDSWYANLWLTPTAWFTSVDREWINTLQTDISASISASEMGEIFKFMPTCANQIADDILIPLKLNSQAFIKKSLFPNSKTKAGATEDGKSFCFENTDQEIYCIPVMEDQLERLNEAQTLESLIRQTTTIINKINSEYTTYEEKSVGTGSDKKIICEKKLNLFDISVLGLFQFSNDSFTTKERAHIISYVKTLRKYLQDMLRVKFLMRSIKEVLPDLRKGDKNAAASRLRQIFQNKSTKAEWITSATYPGYWGPGFQKPAGEFRDKLDEVNLKKLEFEFESVSKCLLKSP